jgi:hypothetical protein
MTLPDNEKGLTFEEKRLVSFQHLINYQAVMPELIAMITRLKRAENLNDIFTAVGHFSRDPGTELAESYVKIGMVCGGQAGIINYRTAISNLLDTNFNIKTMEEFEACKTWEDVASRFRDGGGLNPPKADWDMNKRRDL